MSDESDVRVDADDCDLALDETTLETLSDRLEDESVADAVDVFSALGSETRYRVLVFLDSVDQEVCVCEIEAYLDVSQSTISQALSQLRGAGLVQRRKDGRWRYYTTTALGEHVLRATASEPVDPKQSPTP